MTPLVEFSSESLLCHAQHLTSLPDWFLVDRRSQSFGDITCFDVMDDAAALARLRPLAIDDLSRVMDHFYLWTPCTAPTGRQLLLDALFDFAARDFDLLVHPDQNRENIHQLLTEIGEHCGSLRELQILDFGCGPGLSAEVARNLGVLLTGYDRCPKMRSAAMERGLPVLTPTEFTALHAPAFDAAFASYVFHLSPSRHDLQRLWELLRPGGVLSANFHKDHGLAEATACFSGFGAETKIIERIPSHFQHGSYRLYVRRR